MNDGMVSTTISGGGGVVGGGVTTTTAATIRATNGGAGAGGGIPIATDVLEERMIDEEYKVWKKNTPFLYDYVMTHSLEWPSLTCQWLPHTRSLNTSLSGVATNNNNNNKNNGNNNNNHNMATTEEHNLLIGTHTTGEQNYLMVAGCILPKYHHNDDNDDDDNKNNNNNATTIINNNNTQQQQQQQRTKISAPEYDEEKNEFGGFTGSNEVGKIDIKMKILHEGEVNLARYMPQNHFIVASRGPNSEIYIFDLSKHKSLPDLNTDVFSPQIVLIGHEKEGYGMVWSSMNTGHLATASFDTTVRLWDTSHQILSTKSHISTTTTATGGGTASAAAPVPAPASTTGTQIKPYATLSYHTDTVEDVDWHSKDPNLIVSVGADRRMCLWDKNNHTKPHFVVNDAHSSDINSVSFNHKNEFVLATGSSDRTVGIWDVRYLKTKVHCLNNVHTDEVFTVEWNPNDQAILSSCSADRRVAIWDLSRVGQEQSYDDAQDGPPELIFLHGGHTAKVSDINWNTNSPWTMMSVSEDNIIQIWTMAEELYSEDNNNNNNGKDQEGLGPDELE